ncbi:Permease of the major facilitator superfamily [Streptococcus suis 05ZYH33]|nr:Permease of the major facilitator superfamily [Streptococcus suis 05ZYH33]
MLKKLLKKHPDIVAVTVFFLFSLTLLLPQILTKAVVTGDDIVFHYNRFYDTAIQIKSGDFSYIMSLHGYQQSGRIVNALYGPYLAYLQGALLLLAGTWYRYQLLSNLLLGVLSATSLYFLMREVKVLYSLSVGLSMFFATTYSVQYWWVAQGFSSWGVALFPLCLIPAVRFLKTGKVPIFLMAGAVGLMLQIHMLSALFLILAYAILFSIGWLKSQDKWNVMKDVLFSVGVFLILTVNIWLPLLYVNATNELAAPFINKKFIQSTVTWSKAYFLYFPYSLPIIFATSLYFMLKKWKKQSVILRGLTVTFLVFFIFSTNLFPWQLFAGKGIGLVDLIQFPFNSFCMLMLYF